MKEIIYKLARRFKYSGFPGQKVVNLMYYDPATVVMHMDNLDYVVVDGCKFYITDQIDSIQRVKGNPWFSNVKPTDTVVDIGANIGAITIPLAKLADKVYAVEPLFDAELAANVRLNELDNVEILPVGIGCKAIGMKFEFSSARGKADCITFEGLKRLTGQIDFIKIDCEGCEWSIEPEQLAGIREIRIEFHFRRGHKRDDLAKYKRWEMWLNHSNYKWSVDRMKIPPCIPFFDYLLVNASKR